MYIHDISMLLHNSLLHTYTSCTKLPMAGNYCLSRQPANLLLAKQCGYYIYTVQQILLTFSVN